MEDFGVAAPEKAADEQAKDTQNRNVQLLIKTKLG